MCSILFASEWLQSLPAEDTTEVLTSHRISQDFHITEMFDGKKIFHEKALSLRVIYMEADQIQFILGIKRKSEGFQRRICYDKYMKGFKAPL